MGRYYQWEYKHFREVFGNTGNIFTFCQKATTNIHKDTYGNVFL